jgi:hypothetical protein
LILYLITASKDWVQGFNLALNKVGISGLRQFKTIAVSFSQQPTNLKTDAPLKNYLTQIDKIKTHPNALQTAKEVAAQLAAIPAEHSQYNYAQAALQTLIEDLSVLYYSDPKSMDVIKDIHQTLRPTEPVKVLQTTSKIYPAGDVNDQNITQNGPSSNLKQR